MVVREMVSATNTILVVLVMTVAEVVLMVDMGGNDGVSGRQW